MVSYIISNCLNQSVTDKILPDEKSGIVNTVQENIHTAVIQNLSSWWGTVFHRRGHECQKNIKNYTIMIRFLCFFEKIFLRFVKVIVFQSFIHYSKIYFLPFLNFTWIFEQFLVSYFSFQVPIFWRLLSKLLKFPGKFCYCHHQIHVGICSYRNVDDKTENFKLICV